ncbi:DUF5682 family protein [Nocardia pneumoniae]|uniref:DUF5682 family protein n=1 Tax=Nocardia pneumoniae TaxID=228601 RepID=UPI0002D8A660|nr:DUF5682 family protein [Nocardia pneumoniae]
MNPESTPVTKVFGIRHHGPGSARSLRLALEAFRPDMILIEGPADADPLVGYVAADGMTPPVALLAYVPDTPAKAAFWPYAVFSPEWQALRYAVDNDVPVRFCDLPATIVLAVEDEPGDRFDPLAALAEAGGYDDAERWWDAVVESVPDADAFEPITEAMAALRESAEREQESRPGPVDEPANTESPHGEPVNGRTDAEPAKNEPAHAEPANKAPAQADLAHDQPPRAEAANNQPADAERGNADSAHSERAEHGIGSTESANDHPARADSAGGRPAHTGPSAHDEPARDLSAEDAAPEQDSVAEAISDTEFARRQPHEPITIDAHTLRREAYMRQTMRKALKDGATRLAVVCGAWHAPALTGALGPAAPDARLLKGLPKTKARLTWVPWTHSRLSTSSGYGAGVTSPGWYHHLFTETERPIARWLTKVAGVLRAHDLPVSSAHVIESVRLADTLAALRGRPLAGLSEVTEATRSVLCGGDETMLRLVIGELVVGEALGAVPEQTPTVPLEADLRATIRSLRMKQEPLARTIDLDLRKEREVARSRLLHRLRVLDIDWGTLTTSDVRSTGTFRETWTLEWRPEYAISIIEASRWGTTLRTAAEAKILDTASSADRTVGELTAALEVALLADLGGATDGLIARLESTAALDHDVTHLLAALPGLIRTLRYGDVRGTDTKALAHVADGLLVRVCAGLSAAVTGLDTDAATELRTLLDAAHTAIHTRDDSWATGEWLNALRRVADRDDVHGALVGRAVRLLADAGRIDDAESARRLSAALSVGNPAAAKAAWIDGFLGGRGLLLVHDRELLRLIDDWLRGLGDDTFVETLPLLRRTFGAFESGERRAIGQAVRDGGSVAVSSAAAGIDMDRATVAVRTAAEILGVTV